MSIIFDALVGYLIGYSIKNLWLALFLSVIGSLAIAILLAFLPSLLNIHPFNANEIANDIIEGFFGHVWLVLLIMYFARRKEQKGWAA